MRIDAGATFASLGIALIVSAAGLALRMAFDPILGSGFPYLFFFLAVIVGAWFGGFGSGVLTALLTGAAAVYYYSLPLRSLRLLQTSDQAAFLVFLGIGTLVSLITSNLRNTAARERASAAEARQRADEYSSFFELSAVGAAEHLPPEGRFIRVNRKLVEMCGYSEEELLRLSLISITHPDDRAADLQAYRKLLSGEQTFNVVEKRLLKKDGSSIWVISNRTAVRDSSGKLLRTLAVLQDVTDRHRAEEAQRFLVSASTILGSSLDPEETLSAIGDLCVGWLCEWCTVVVMEPGGTLRRVAAAHRDPAKRQLLRQLMDKHPPTRDHQDDLVHVIESGQSIVRNEIPEPVQQRLDSAPELQRILADLGIGAYLVVPLTTRGRTIGALSLVAQPGRAFDDRDVAVARELGLRAASAIDNATLFRESERANRLKDEFFATVSHELKTPMTTILGWSQMLKAERLDEPTSRTAVESIYRSALAQAKIIDDILDVARIGTGKLALESAPVDLALLLEAVVHAMQPAADAKEVSLDLQQDSGHPSLIVIGDATRLQQVFVNLVSNGIKFTAAGGRVALQLQKRGGDAVVTVTDDGIGIGAEFLPHIFDAFRQAHANASSGLGLGLTIAQRLVQGHGGSLEAHSDGYGKGAQFIVTLPLAAEQLATG